MIKEEEQAAQETITRAVYNNLRLGMIKLRDLDDEDEELLHELAETVGVILYIDSAMRHGVILNDFGHRTYGSACARRNEIMDTLGFEGGPYQPKLNA